MLTVETKVWERDWESGIKHGRVERFFQLIPTPAHRRLLINNVAFPHRVVETAQDLLARQIVHEIVVVADHLDAALDHFRLTRDMLGAGLPYSSAELVGLFTCPTEFLCHFAGDCVMGHTSDWIGEGIELLRRRVDIAVVSPLWNGSLREALEESPQQDGDYLLGHGFTDQCYLVRAAELKSANLLRFHPASDRYPKYGGDLFEKRVDSWLRLESKFRTIDPRATCLHLR